MNRGRRETPPERLALRVPWEPGAAWAASRRGPHVAEHLAAACEGEVSGRTRSEKLVSEGTGEARSGLLGWLWVPCWVLGDHGIPEIYSLLIRKFIP